MLYVIMCGGVYSKFATPKPLTKIYGKPNVLRTIDFLREAGIPNENIFISSTDKRYDQFKVTRLEHENSFRSEDDKLYGYWVDAFYPYFEEGTEVTYLFGDVVYTFEAISTIVTCGKPGNILFGSKLATNKLHKDWGEPFAYVVHDYKTFMEGVQAVKRFQDEGKYKRLPIVWEVYRYLNGLDFNLHEVLDETFVVIDDETIDIDSVEQQRNWES